MPLLLNSDERPTSVYRDIGLMRGAPRGDSPVADHCWQHPVNM